MSQDASREPVGAVSRRGMVSIVIPVFNEEESLGILCREVTMSMASAPEYDYEVLIVDDGSTDGSYQAARAIALNDPKVFRAIQLRRNFGQTAAMAAGFDAARGDIVVPLDGDLQNDPMDIPRLLEKIEEGFDVVSGWRVDRQDKAISRRLPSQAANWLISRITGIHLHDYGCTLKAYHRSVVDDLHFYGEMHRFLPALASWNGAMVTEIPVNHRPRRFGETKYGIDRALRVFLDLLTIKFLLSYSTKPMQVFGKWGFFSLLGGLFVGLMAVVLKFTPPYQDVTDNPWMYLSVFLFLSGLQLVGMGLLGEIGIRTYYESQGKRIYSVREDRTRETPTAAGLVDGEND